MQTLTAVIPNQPLLPQDLELLHTPVCTSEPSSPAGYAGRTDGALLDEEGHVVAFIVRLSRKLDPDHRRILVPVTSLTVTGGWLLHLRWTTTELLAQPRLDDDLQLRDRGDGGAPVESPWRPARPSAVPPDTPPEIQRLEERLSDPGLAVAGIVSTLRVSPLTTTEAPAERARVAGWR